jgi:hypothetical protein
MPVNHSTLELKQEEPKFEASLDYMVRPCLLKREPPGNTTVIYNSQSPRACGNTRRHFISRSLQIIGTFGIYFAEFGLSWAEHPCIRKSNCLNKEGNPVICYNLGWTLITLC